MQASNPTMAALMEPSSWLARSQASNGDEAGLFSERGNAKNQLLGVSSGSASRRQTLDLIRIRAKNGHAYV
jgi:hypothetical protein